MFLFLLLRHLSADSMSFRPSVSRVSSIDQPGTLSVVSMYARNHEDVKWFIPSFHNTSLAETSASVFCHAQLYAIALKTTMMGLGKSGVGILMTGNFSHDDLKNVHLNVDTDTVSSPEPSYLHCFYTTNRGMYSDHDDFPRTVSVAVYCPIYPFHAMYMSKGSTPVSPTDICTAMQTASDTYTLYIPRPPQTRNRTSRVMNALSGVRGVFNYSPSSRSRISHAVGTVQTYVNPVSGMKLVIFARYYLSLGYTVLIYDRYGAHRSHLQPLFSEHNLVYAPYTVLQIALPSVYNSGRQESTEYRYYSGHQKQHSPNKHAELADTMNQDSDKQKTYDMMKLDHPDLSSILMLDSDEFLYCPQAPDISSQGAYQDKILTRLRAEGVEEVKLVRRAYSGRHIYSHTASTREIDITNRTNECMLSIYSNITATGVDLLRRVLGCWSGVALNNNPGKSGDIGGVCPFHWNHLSCVDWKEKYLPSWQNKKRCFCRVKSPDMIPSPRLTYNPIRRFSGEHMEPVCFISHLNNDFFQSENGKFKINSTVIAAGPANPLASLW